ncbi:hypothetical protein NQ317_002975 [Molorchus minor]|uniref:Uncharacterized protein n=1 Tax=Molorchus minor TaxID=1323400 RepID=A0ABQ9J7S8_9CUCU|nr:hypothetical protein NQ317_002975 [Molorchus minor]
MNKGKINALRFNKFIVYVFWPENEERNIRTKLYNYIPQEPPGQPPIVGGLISLMVLILGPPPPPPPPGLRSKINNFNSIY